MRLTPHIDDCVQSLNENAECQSDVVMACLGRLQMVVQRIGQVPSHFEIQPLGISTPIGLFVKALQAQLQEVRKDLPQDLDQNGQISSASNPL